MQPRPCAETSSPCEPSFILFTVTAISFFNKQAIAATYYHLHKPSSVIEIHLVVVRIYKEVEENCALLVEESALLKKQSLKAAAEKSRRNSTILQVFKYPPIGPKEFSSELAPSINEFSSACFIQIYLAMINFYQSLSISPPLTRHVITQAQLL